MTEDKSLERDVSLGEAGYWQKLLRKKSMEGFFLFVTSQCNSKCRTCFNHANLNKDDDMSFEQIRRLSETAGSIDKLWLSGGEPFLRDGLVDIIGFFVKNNGVKSINLPTNGLLTERIVEWTGILLQRCPDLAVYLNFSVDGLGATHDLIRGIPGNFATTVNTLDKVYAAHGSNPNLYINIATIITREGYEDVLPLASYVEEKGFTDLHIFEVVRGDPPDPSLKAISLEEVKAIHKKLYPVLSKDADKLFREFKGTKKKIARMSYLGIMNLMFRIKEENFNGPHHWGMNCTAGKTTLVVDANGYFRSCEMRPPIGNMRDYDYDTGKAFYSIAMKDEIRTIGGGEKANCWCSHGCWINSSLKFSPRTMLFRIPKLAREYEKLAGESSPLPKIDVEAIENYQEAVQL